MLGEFDFEEVTETDGEEYKRGEQLAQTDRFTLREFLSSLTNVKDGVVIKVTDGPLYLSVDHTDAEAAAILLFLYENAKDDETIAKTEVTLMSNLLHKLEEAAIAAKAEETGDYAVKDLLTDSVRSILSAWWWMTYISAGRQYDADFDADAKNWEPVPKEPNPNIRVFSPSKEGREAE